MAYDNYGEIQKYAQGMLETCNLSIGSYNIKNDLENQILGLKEKLANKEELLKLLQKNPDFERILTLMRG